MNVRQVLTIMFDKGVVLEIIEFRKKVGKGRVEFSPLFG